MGNAATKADAYSMILTDTNKLGEGKYGIVYKIMTKYKNTICVAKIFKVPFVKMSHLEQIPYSREQLILQETSHPFVIKQIEEFVYKDKLCIVTQFASGGDFEKYMRNRSFQRMKQCHILQ